MDRRVKYYFNTFILIIPHNLLPVNATQSLSCWPPDFPPHAGGGEGAFEHPHLSISAPIGRRGKKQKKDVLKLVKNGYETTSVIFRVR